MKKRTNWMGLVCLFVGALLVGCSSDSRAPQHSYVVRFEGEGKVYLKTSLLQPDGAHLDSASIESFPQKLTFRGIGIDLQASSFCWQPKVKLVLQKDSLPPVNFPLTFVAAHFADYPSKNQSSGEMTLGDWLRAPYEIITWMIECCRDFRDSWNRGPQM